MGNAGFRQIDPEMWGDPYFLELNPDEKLLYIYMFTNERTSLCGLYEISKKQITFYSGLDNKLVDKTINKFQKSEKIICENDVYFVINLFKRHFSKSPKVIARINNDIENIHDCKPKSLCIQKYEELHRHPYPIHIVSGKAVYSTDTETHKIREKKMKEKEEKRREDEDDIEVTISDTKYLKELSATFEELTHTTLEPAQFLPLLKIGATENDMRQAVRELAGKDLIIPTTAKGMWNPVINVINKRKAKGEQVEPDYRKYIKGKYGKFGFY